VGRLWEEWRHPRDDKGRFARRGGQSRRWMEQALGQMEALGKLSGPGFQSHQGDIDLRPRTPEQRRGGVIDLGAIAASTPKPPHAPNPKAADRVERAAADLGAAKGVSAEAKESRHAADRLAPVARDLRAGRLDAKTASNRVAAIRAGVGGRVAAEHLQNLDTELAGGPAPVLRAPERHTVRYRTPQEARQAVNSLERDGGALPAPTMTRLAYEADRRLLVKQVAGPNARSYSDQQRAATVRRMLQLQEDHGGGNSEQSAMLRGLLDRYDQPGAGAQVRRSGTGGVPPVVVERPRRQEWGETTAPAPHLAPRRASSARVTSVESPTGRQGAAAIDRGVDARQAGGMTPPTQTLPKQATNRERAQTQYARDRAQFEGKSRAWLLKQARDRYRIEVPRGESDERIVDALTRASIIEKIEKQPPGSTPGQAPELRSDLQALGRGTLNDRKHRGDTVAGLADLADLYEQSRQASKTGTVPPFTVNVARQIVAREGLDVRNAPGQKRMRQLLGMPEQPTGEQESLHANELGFGDVVSLGGFGGHVASVVEHDDGKVSITMFGPIGQTYTIPGDRQVKARLAERRGLAGMTQGVRREAGVRSLGTGKEGSVTFRPGQTAKVRPPEVGTSEPPTKPASADTGVAKTASATPPILGRKAVEQLSPGDRVKRSGGIVEVTEVPQVGTSKAHGKSVKITYVDENGKTGSVIVPHGRGIDVVSTRISRGDTQTDTTPNPQAADAIDAIRGSRDWGNGDIVLGEAFRRAVTGDAGPIATREPTRTQERDIDQALRAVANELGIDEDRAYDLTSADVDAAVLTRAAAKTRGATPPAPAASQTAGARLAAERGITPDAEMSATDIVQSPDGAAWQVRIPTSDPGRYVGPSFKTKAEAEHFVITARKSRTEFDQMRAQRPATTPTAQPQPTPADVTAARTALTQEINTKVRREAALADIAQQANATAAADWRQRLETTPEGDRLADRIGTVSGDIARHDATAADLDQTFNDLRQIADDPAVDPARRQAAADLADRVGKVQVPDVTAQRRDLLALSGDASTLEAFDRRKAEAIKTQQGGIDRVRETAAKKARTALVEQFGGDPNFEQGMTSEERGWVNDYVDKATIAAIRAHQVEATKRRSRDANDVAAVVRTDQGRASVGAIQQQISAEVRRDTEQQQMYTYQAQDAKAHLQGLVERRKAQAARRAEEAARGAARRETNATPVELDVRELGRVERELVPLIQESDARVAADFPPAADFKKEVARRKRALQIPADSSIKKLPYEKQHFARQAATAVNNEAAASAIARRQQGRIAVIEQRLADPSLRPATREKLQRTLNAYRNGYMPGTGMQAPVTDADVAAIVARRDLRVGAWQAANVAVPGERGGPLDPALLAGLNDEEARVVSELNDMIGHNAAVHLVNQLRDRR